MHPALKRLDHRPWPLPQKDWTWNQSWLDLAFIHYRVDAKEVASRLPPGMRLQEFDGSAWVGIVPFRMSNVTRRPFQHLVSFPSFPELNLRTYVEYEGKPGVWFFSLDADSWPVVFGGRRFYHLPYFSAKMRQEKRGDWHLFSSERRRGNARFEAKYRAIGETYLAKANTFEHWATERYCLYSFSTRGGIERVEVHHEPWPLQQAEVTLQDSNMLSAVGLCALTDAAICHFSKGVHVAAFAKERV